MSTQGAKEEMEFIGSVINCSILISLIILTWVLPRMFGGLGLLAAHFCALFGWVAVGGVVYATGIWPSYEPEIQMLMMFVAFVFNCLMLPLGIWAACRWRRLPPRAIDCFTLRRV